MSGSEPVPAGMGVRLKAFGFDYLLISAYLAATVAIGVAMNQLWPVAARTLFGNPIAGQGTGFVMVTLPVSLYFALTEASAREATWGKTKVGLRVTDVAGRRLSLGRSMGRTGLKFFPWELAHLCVWQVTFATDTSSPLFALGFIGVWLLVGADVGSLIADPRRRSLHDRLAGTRVVYREDHSPNQRMECDSCPVA